jgi:hypothetical protein
MSVVTGTNTINVSINQQGGLGVAPATGILPAAVLALRSSFPTSGTGADSFALCHANPYVFAASTPQTINLNSLLDIKGNAISFSVVRYFAYQIVSSNPAFTLLAGDATTNPWIGILATATSQMIWYPSSGNNDGFMVVQAPSATGIPVSPTNCNLLLNPGSNPVGTVNIIIAGS